MKIIEIIFEKMNEKGIKQQELADKLGIRKSVVSSWKTRNTNPPLEYIVQICELIEISPNELLGYSNNTIEEIYKKLAKEDREIVDNIFSRYSKQEQKSSTYKIG